MTLNAFVAHSIPSFPYIPANPNPDGFKFMSLQDILNQPFNLMLLLIGIALLLNPFFNIKRYQRYKRRTEITLGKVLGQDEQISNTKMHSRTRIKTDHAIVGYIVNGRPYELISESGASWTLHKTGSHVTVSYDPLEPENADIQSSHQTNLKIISGLIYAGPVIGLVLIITQSWKIFF